MCQRGGTECARGRSLSVSEVGYLECQGALQKVRFCVLLGRLPRSLISVQKLACSHPMSVSC